MDLFSFVGMYQRGLASVTHLLRKGEEHARAAGVTESEFLGWRLADDMFPLRRQVQVVCSFAARWPARVAGLPDPVVRDEEETVAGLLAAAEEARLSLGRLRPEQFIGRDGVPFTFSVDSGLESTLPLGRWLAGFAMPNFYFRLVATYSILRAKGVELGKIDFFAGGF